MTKRSFKRGLVRGWTNINGSSHNSSYCKYYQGSSILLERPWILIHTWVDVYFNVERTKSFVQGKSLSTPWFRVKALTDLTLLTSSKEEKENSKKPFPKEVTPHFYIEDHSSNCLSFKLTTINGVGHFVQTTLPCRWCLHAYIQRLYSSSRMLMTSLLPFRQGISNWLCGMLQMLFETIDANVFRCCEVVFLSPDLCFWIGL